MEDVIKPGIKKEMIFKVEKEHVATFLESYGIQVLSTPSMISMMEKTSRFSVQDLIDNNHTTVGASVNVRHLAPAPIGSEIKVKVCLRKIEGRRLTFEIQALSEKGIVGKGIHERYIVDISEFAKRI